MTHATTLPNSTDSADPCDLSTRVLARRLQVREITATEVMEAFLTRIEERNPALNAVVSLDVARARAEAAEADAAIDRGDVYGPLHGVPLTLKDGHDVAGLRTTIGTHELDRVATADGTVAERLRAAGAIIVGHTNVSPWLADYQTANPVFGRTNNPWDLERTPGGSSGGAAAAVAAGLTPFEICSDLAGSARLPAHFCGVYGLKTTEHRVPLTGFFRMPPGVPSSVRILSTLGPMARDLDDIELALSLIAGPDGHDTDVPPVPLGGRRALPLERLRVCVAPTVPGATVSAALRQQVEEIAARAWDAGAQISDCLPILDWEADLALFGDLVQCITGLFNPAARLRDEQRSLSWYLSALARRDQLMRTWEAFFERHDVLVLPPAVTSAFTHRASGGDLNVDGQQVPYEAQGRLLAFANLAGLPALSVPAGFDEEGLPVGVQLVGPLWSEMRLLDIARALEAADVLPGFRPPYLQNRDRAFTAR